MLPEDLDEARDWLLRAERDLIMARRALESDVILADQAAYHSQQVVEKALKAFLASQGVAFTKTHDLVRLVVVCRGIDPSFARFLDTAQTLNPFVTQFRYPGGPLEPDLSEAEDAIRRSEEVLRHVRGTLTLEAE